MKRCLERVLPFGLVLFLLLGVVQTTLAQSSSSVAAKLAEALDHRIYGRFDEGISIANNLLGRESLTAQDSVAILEVLSIIYYSKGEEFYKKSYSYLDQISIIGPCVSKLPQDIWPKGLRKQWYSVANAKGKLTCDETEREGMHTIAVMPFDNHSVGEFQEKLGALGAGLASFFQYDFSKISSLSIVERDKIDYIIEEHQLSESGKVDQASALKAGKILAAHLMVFGSFTQIDRSQTRIVVRAVNVETSEVVASVSADGRPDYFKLEKELVQKLAEELAIKLTSEDKALIDVGGTKSLDATSLYAQGLEFEDQYDYQKAYDLFKQAYEQDPEFKEAKAKMDIYRPLATG